ncbi:MAG: hypothetical protein HOC71_12205 [Candidatus Latescibacteria bacterium]|jgi:hypothetical protein|nr:hypothetical protein [Candidatus Latescibacterota bacterium]
MQVSPRKNVLIYGQIYLYVFVAILAVMCVALFNANNALNESLTQAHEENSSIKEENELIADILKKVRTQNKNLLRNQSGPNEEEIDELKRKGLDDPYNNIISDLGSRRELIPLKDESGARPSVFENVSMYLLNSKWAYASFDYDSTLEQTLLEYRVSDSGEIIWEAGVYPLLSI